MSDAAPTPVRFEDALKELDGIVRSLEDGEIGLEDSLARYERGVGLVKQCFAQLEQAELRVQKVTGETAEGQAVTELFEPSAIENTTAKARRK